MRYLPLLWIVWASVVAVWLALLAYRGTLTRYEEDQLFLDDGPSLEHDQQEAVLRRVNRISPIVRIWTSITVALTATILVVYVWHAFRLVYP